MLTRPRHEKSVARQVLVLQLIAVLVLVVTALALATYDARNDIRFQRRFDELSATGQSVTFDQVVEEISRRWHRMANFDEFSMGQLIMESVGKGAKYHMYFPVEMVLMVGMQFTKELTLNYEIVGAALRGRPFSNFFSRNWVILLCSVAAMGSSVSGSC